MLVKTSIQSIIYRLKGGLSYPWDFAFITVLVSP